MSRPITVDEQPARMNACSARRQRVFQNAQQVRDPEAAARTSESSTSIEDVVRIIARSPLRSALLMTVMFQLSARTIALLRWKRAALDALTIECPRSQRVQLLPLPLTVAAFLHEGDRPDALSSEELEYELHRFDAQWSLANIRRDIFEACAISDLRSRSLSEVGTAVGFDARRRSIERVDIGLLMHMETPPTSLAESSDMLKAIPTVSDAGRRLILLRLSRLHSWTERDVLAVTRRSFPHIRNVLQ